MAALGMRGLRPAREVANEFEAEANRLWRPDRRGRPRFRVLQYELAGLDERRREALERDRTLRARVAERVAAKARLGLLARSPGEASGSGARCSSIAWAGCCMCVAAWSGSMSSAGPRARRRSWTACRANPRGHLDALRGRRRAAGVRVEELAREAAICRETVRAYGDGPSKARLSRTKRACEGPSASKVGMPELEREVAAADNELAEMIERCKRLSGWLFSVPLTDVSQEAIRRVPNSELRGCVRDYEGARAKLDVEEEGDGGRSLMRLPGAMRPGPARLVAGVALLAAGLALSAWPILVPDATLALGDILVTRDGCPERGAAHGRHGDDSAHRAPGRRSPLPPVQRAVAAAERQRTDRIADLRAGAEAAKGAVRDAGRRASRRVRASGRRRTSICRLGSTESRISWSGCGSGSAFWWSDARSSRVRAAKSAACRAGWRRRWTTNRWRIWGGLTGVLEQALKAREGAAVAQQHLERIEGERAQAEGEREAAAWEEDSFETRLAVLCRRRSRTGRPGGFRAPRCLAPGR